MSLTTPHPFLCLMFFEFSRTAFSMCASGVVLLGIGFMAARRSIARTHGIDKIVGLSNLCFATPLAVFGALHLSAAQGVSQLVPKFMPWPLFWTYVVGFGLVAASLSIATKNQVRSSGFLFGLMMFTFVSMMDLPGALAERHNRISWILLCREMSFGAGGWMLAAAAMDRPAEQSRKRALLIFGRAVIGLTAIFYGVQHFLHTPNVPGVPLEKLMPAWIPAHAAIAYLTGAILLVGGICMVIGREVRVAAGSLGGWILLLVILIYGPILIMSLINPSTDVKVEGINYFFDTLLYAGTVLALASAVPPGS